MDTIVKFIRLTVHNEFWDNEETQEMFFDQRFLHNLKKYKNDY